jgi:hypothetical protein
MPAVVVSCRSCRKVVGLFPSEVGALGALTEHLRIVHEEEEPERTSILRRFYTGAAAPRLRLRGRA